MKKRFWEKLVWIDENTLEPTAYAWMVTLGDWMVPFRVLEYNSSIFQKKKDIKKVLEKEEKTLEKKKSEEQEENIPYTYKCYLHF